MKRFTLALYLSAAIIAPAQAQIPLTGVGVGSVSSGGGGGGYTGPGDVIASAVGWWGLRAYTAAYATGLGNAVEVCTAADALCTVVHVTAAGDLNSSDLTTSGCSVITTCTVKTLYDQSGNSHNCVQATEASRPTFQPNGISSGKPSMRIATSSGQRLSCASLPTTAVPWSFVGVARQDTTPAGNTRVFVAADPVGLIVTASDNWALYAGSVVSNTVTISHSTYYAIIGRTDGTGTGGVVSVSGTVTTGLNPGSNSTGTPGEFSTFSSGMSGYMSEYGYWGSNFSTGDTTSLNSNMQTYWGI